MNVLAVEKRVLETVCNELRSAMAATKCHCCGIVASIEGRRSIKP